MRSSAHRGGRGISRGGSPAASKSTAVQLVSRSRREEQVGRLRHVSPSHEHSEDHMDDAVRHILGQEPEFESSSASEVEEEEEGKILVSKVAGYILKLVSFANACTDIFLV